MFLLRYNSFLFKRPFEKRSTRAASQGRRVGNPQPHFLFWSYLLNGKALSDETHINLFVIEFSTSLTTHFYECIKI